MDDASRLNVLLLGSGGREHALAWGISRSPRLGRLVLAPGNPGMATLGELATCDIENPEVVVELARRVKAHLVVVGPEGPLAAGVSNALANAGIPVFGPSREAARLEWDKAFAKDFMERAGVPTSASRTFDSTQLDLAVEFVRGHRYPVVVKACGLAAGKGVIIAQELDEAKIAVTSILSGDAFGPAGSSIVVEEFMEGEEASIFAITDGARYIVLAPSQDHKRAFDNDVGPNTGGMGAYAPAPVITPEVMERVCSSIIEPTLLGMREAGTPYVGCLYVGLMVSPEREPRVVEFNSRFGDPESQVIVPLYDGDFLELLFAAAVGSLPATGIAPTHGAAACVVIASEGYPGTYRKGVAIQGLMEAESREGVIVFHAGTALAGTEVVTSGGRVLGVTAIDKGGDLGSAIAKAYDAVGAIAIDGAFHRSDIGRRALELPTSSTQL